MEKSFQTSGADALQYLKEQLPKLAQRLSLKAPEIEELKILIEAAYENEMAFEKQPDPFMKSTPQSKALDYFLLKRMLTSWEIEGKQNLLKALEHYSNGHRVVFMLNHTGNIDGPLVDYIFESFIEKDFPKTWVAGKRVWESPFLRMFSRCVDMVTVFGEKYIKLAQEKGDSEEISRMRNHNAVALRWMIKNKSMLFVFPQGTWCNAGHLTEGVPSVMSIIRAISGNGTKTVIVPCYVEGADKMMPPSGKPGDDFYYFIEVFQCGEVILRFGEPQQLEDIMSQIPNKTSKEEIDKWLIDYVMRKIADFAPTEEARGPYAKSLR